MGWPQSCCAADGSLKSIDATGDSSFRFPEAVAEYAIERRSKPGDWVLDPFAGFGTTLIVARWLQGQGTGFEVDDLTHVEQIPGICQWTY